MNKALLAVLLEERAARIDRERCEGSLYEFVRYMWPVVEPANPLIEGWVMEAICEHLEAITWERVQPPRMIINVPPGSSKSLLTDVFWPAWEWGPCNLPHLRYVCFSYSAQLTERDNERFARLVASAPYQRLWGDRLSLTKTGVTKIQNNKTGWKYATSIGGVGTGERGDRVIIDDANNVKETESEVVRGATNQWLREVMPSRLNHLDRSAIVCIQQRTHEEDATGTLLDGDYCHLMIPMRYDPARHCETPIGWSDPRTIEGELCWPERFSPDAVARLERDIGPYATAGQLQQSPEARGGGLIRREWWREWEPREYPPFEFVVGSLDTAVKDKEQSDYYAFVALGVWRDPDTGVPRVMLVYAWQERAPLHTIVERVILDCRRFKVDTLIIEDKANGPAAQQELMRLSAGWKFGVTMFDPRRYGDKTARLLSVQHLFAEGLIFAPVLDAGFRAWAQMVIDQVAMFPRAAHDDLVDAVSMGLRYLRDVGFALKASEFREEEDTLMRRPPQRAKALYPV